MKVLILSSGIGGGHGAAAEAVREELARQGHTAAVVDAIDLVSRAAGRLVEGGHVWLYRHAPRPIDFGYEVAERRSGRTGEGSEVRRGLGLGRKKITRLVLEGGYDAVFCTHVFAAMMAGGAKTASGLSVPIAFLATDYTCSPGVTGCNLDGCFIPDESLAEEFVDKGIPREKLIAGGMPVRSDFRERMPQAEAKRALGLDPHQRHLLMMGGSMGCGPMQKLTEDLAERMPADAVLTVCCGTNEKLFRNLDRRFGGHPAVRVLGYTDEVALLMDGADLCLTKAGGLSLSEAMNKRLPVCLIHAVEGCEKRNADFFVRHGMAVAPQTEDEFAALCVRLLDDEAQLEAMRRAMERRAPENGAAVIVRWLAENTPAREKA